MFGGSRRVTLDDVEVESEPHARRPALVGGARLRWKTTPWVSHKSNAFRTARLLPSHAFDDLEAFFEKVRPLVHELLRAEVAKGPIKVKCTVELLVTRTSDEACVPKNLTSGAESKGTLLPLVRSADIAPAIVTMLDKVRRRFEGFEEGGSGWRFIDANWLELRVFDFVPQAVPPVQRTSPVPRGFIPAPSGVARPSRVIAALAHPAPRGSRRGASFIPTPTWLVNKRCIINVHNDDDRCLEYAILSALHASDVDGHRERPQTYERFLGSLTMEGVAFPASVDDAASISEMNAVPLHVLGLDVTRKDNVRFTVEHFNRVRSARDPIMLLRLHRGAERGHFVWVRGFNAFVRSSRNSLYCCVRCLQRFSRRSAFENHTQKACITYEPMKKTLPLKYKSNVAFKGIAKQLHAPFILYADIESLLVPADEARGAKTTAYQTHVPWFVGAQLVSRYPDELASGYVYFVGKDCIDRFLAWLFDIEAKAVHIVSTNKPMTMTPAQHAAAAAQTACHICADEMGGDRVFDHDHVTGAYRGVAHKACNLAYSYRHFKLPVFFHNLAGYDAHFLLQRAGAFGRKMSCLAKTAERMVSFSIGRCIFKDSLQFLNSSLAKCVESLAPTDFAVHDVAFGGVSAELRTLLRQKGVMPYDWLDDAEKLDAALPQQAAFYSQLSKTACSDEDYARAQRVWTLAGCRTMREYVALYLQTDVVLLADVFEAFRKVSFEHYRLDAAHYFTLPGFSWDAFLKMTGANIGCIYEGQADAHEMLGMLQRGVRGGVSVVSRRHAVANNPLLSGFDATKARSYIMNWDANNLYGGAMCEALPSGGYSLERIFDDATLDATIDATVDAYATLDATIDATIDASIIVTADADGADANSAAIGANADSVDAADAIMGSADADVDADADNDDANSYGWSECDDNVFDDDTVLDERDAVIIPAPRTTAACLAEVLALDDNGGCGCFLEVDLDIPRELHDELNDYPPAPESTLFPPSPFMEAQRIAHALPLSKAPKLIPNLRGKTQYVLHFRALKAYVKLGCVVTKVHKVLWFEQSAYMAPYIQYNTERRAKAATALEKDMLKLMNNAIFGKTCENVEGRLNVVLVTDGAKIAQYAAKPNFTDMQLIGENLVAVHMRVTSVLYNKPLAVGVAVLDISKTFMYDFHYGYVRRRYGDKAALLFTDTDSLTYCIETGDVYADMLEDLGRFDTSDYPHDHKCFSEANKKVVLKMKDESNGVPIRAFVGLRAKMYCFLTADEKAEATAKGIARSEIARLKWSQYEAALFEGRRHEVSFSAIRSSDHEVATLRLRKTGLCAYDDKRYVIDGVRTLAHGHWRADEAR